MDELSRFCRQQVAQGISLKSSLIEYELRRRGYPYSRAGNRLVLCEIGGRPATFFLMNGPSSSVGVRTICDNKWLSRQLFAANGLSVAQSGRFARNAANAALEFARDKIGYPVVIKPNSASRGRGVSTNVSSDAAFQEAWKNALAASRAPLILVERHARGNDYRFFVAGGKVVSVTWRKRANITGDGRSTVLQLIQNKNAERQANVYVSNYPIPTDPAQLETLVGNGLNLDYVPENNEYVELRDVSNLSAGGDSIDVTGKTHPSFQETAIAAIRSCPGMLYGGVDIIAEDITAPATPTNHVVGEIEFSPAPLSTFPLKGPSRDMAAAILDCYGGLPTNHPILGGS